MNKPFGPTWKFPSAKIFLSHAWQDNEISDRLFHKLSRSFSVDYDRCSYFGKGKPLFSIGEPILNRRAIIGSNFFLFLASKYSMNPSSWAFKELQIAESSHLGLADRIGVVALNDFDVPEEYWSNLFERCAKSSFNKDSVRIVRSVGHRFADFANFTICSDGCIGGLNPNLVVDMLLTPKLRESYLLDVLYPATATERICSTLLSLDQSTKEDISSKLIDLYLSEHRRGKDNFIPPNSIYLLSRLKPNSTECAEEVKAEHPAISESLLYRSFHVALGFLGDEESLNQYSVQLSDDDRFHWNEQKTMNDKFHCFYYGSHEGAIARLRSEIRYLNPSNLMSLDVTTLGDLSAQQSDAWLIRDQRDPLQNLGVNKNLINTAIQKILSKLK